MAGDLCETKARRGCVIDRTLRRYDVYRRVGALFLGGRDVPLLLPCVPRHPHHALMLAAPPAACWQTGLRIGRKQRADQHPAEQAHQRNGRAASHRSALQYSEARHPEAPGGYQPRATGHQLPATRYPLPAKNCQALARNSKVISQQSMRLRRPLTPTNLAGLFF